MGFDLDDDGMRALWENVDIVRLAFNQAFEEPVLMEEKTKPPKVHVEIIDAVARTEK